MKYYISDGKQKFGPLSIEEMENYSIDENTLIWYKGLEKWKYAKNVPEILQLIKKNQQETQSDSPPVPSEKPEKKDNTLKNVGLALGIILIAFIGFEVLNNSDSENNSIKDTSEEGVEQLNKNDIINLLKDYYKADKDQNLKTYKSYYKFPIEEYFNKQYITQEKFDKMINYGWFSTSKAENTPDYYNLNFTYVNNICVVKYPLTYKYTDKKSGDKYIKTFDATIKLNENRKIFYRNHKETSSKKIDHDFSYFKSFEGQYPEETIFKDEFFIERLKDLLNTNGFDFMIENLDLSSEISVDGDIIYFYGCKESDCEDTNFITVLDLNSNEIFVGFKHRTNKRKFREKNGESNYLNYWYDMNQELFRSN